VCRCVEGACEEVDWGWDVSLMQLLIPYLLIHLKLSRTELLKGSTVGNCKLRRLLRFFMISSSFLVLHINSSTVQVHRPLLNLNPDISRFESIYSLRCSLIK